MERTNKILFFVLILILSTAAVVSYFHTESVTTLRGTFKKIDRPAFSSSDWLHGDFQEQMDKRTNYKFFLRSVFIKVRNQIDYHFFDKANATLVSKGKDDMLYSTKYIASYLGENFMGKEAIEDKVEKIEFMQQTLQAMDKQFLVVIGPNKAAYYPDDFPVQYDGATKEISNYDYYLSLFKEKSIPHVDFNKIFVDMKDTVRYPLYSKQGTHWNNYAYQYAWNIIVDSLEQHTDWKFARLESNEIKLEPSKGRDRDLYDLLNVFSVKDTSKMAYQEYTIDTLDIDHPTGLVIADSYFWGIRGLGFSKKVLNDGMYWYYNNTAYPAEDGVLYTPEEYNFRRVIQDTDIVIILATAANFDAFPFGFEKDFYEVFSQPATDEDFEKRDKVLNRMMDKIRKNEEWFGKLKQRSIDENKSLDSLIRIDAAYFLEQQKNDK